jgi:hypothetical protein
MRWLLWVGGALLVAMAMVAAGVGWLTYGAWPEPVGYDFPRHSIWGGPLALFEGTLAVDDGCVEAEGGFSVVWPPGSWLAIEDGQPVVHIGLASIGMGEPVRMGGGFYEEGDLPPTSFNAGTCPPPYFLSTGIAD